MTAQDARYGHGSSDWEMQAVLSALGFTRDAAKKKAAIVEELGGTWTERQVKRAVNALRHEGWLIGSGNEGYWLADERDVEAWLRRQRSQIFSMFRTYRRVQKAQRMRAAQVEQTTLFDAA